MTKRFPDDVPTQLNESIKEQKSRIEFRLVSNTCLKGPIKKKSIETIFETNNLLLFEYYHVYK